MLSRVGRYEIHHEIASGGMATVYAGRLVGDAGFTRTVAVKRLHPQFAKQPEFCAMFMDEARISSQLSHPNVVSTLDVVSEGGELFVVMEYVSGASVARLIQAANDRGEAIPIPIIVAIAIDALDGLHAAHEARGKHGKPLCIVHRDVSPQNIMTCLDGVSRVLDFGIAKAVDRLHTTRDGSIKGKLSYIAPEHVSGLDVDRRADVYGMGAVVWELVAGRRLREAGDLVSIVHAVLGAEVSPPSALRGETLPLLDAAIEKALARDPANRFDTAIGFARALEEAVKPASAREVGSWVAALVGDDLARGERLVGSMGEANAITATVQVVSTLRPPPNLEPTLETTLPIEPAWQAAPDESRSPSRRTLVSWRALALLGVVVGFAVTLVATHLSDRKTPGTSPAAAESSAASPQPIPEATSAASMTPLPASAVAEAAGSVNTARAKVRPSGSSGRPAHTSATAATAPSAPAPPSVPRSVPGEESPLKPYD